MRPSRATCGGRNLSDRICNSGAEKSQRFGLSDGARVHGGFEALGDKMRAHEAAHDARADPAYPGFSSESKRQSAHEKKYLAQVLTAVAAAGEGLAFSGDRGGAFTVTVTRLRWSTGRPAAKPKHN